MEIEYQDLYQESAMDMNGARVFPYDVVVIKRLADFMINAKDEEDIKFYGRFLNCPAMINYQDYGYKNSKIYWYDGIADVHLEILHRTIDCSGFSRFEITFPLNCLKKIEQNSRLLSLFVPFHSVIYKEDAEIGGFFNYGYISEILKENGIAI